MATWQEVKNFVKSNYEGAEESDDGGLITMRLHFTDGRSQFVGLTTFDDKWIQFMTIIGKKSDINVDRLFEECIVFGVTRDDDSYWIVHNQLLETVDPAEIKEALRLLSGYADEVEKAVTRGSDEY